MPSTRRSLLRRSGAALSGGLACLLAGCNGTSEGDPGEGGNRTATYDVPDRTATPPPDLENDPTPDPITTPDPEDAVEFGPLTHPETGPPEYRRWVPRPADLELTPPPGYSETFYAVEYADLERIRDLGAGVPPGFVLHRQFGKLGLDSFGAGVENYRRVVRINGRTAVAVEAPLDRPAVAGTLTGTGYEPAGEHRGYRLFAREDDPRAVAVGDDALVFSGTAKRTRGDPLDVVRTVVDAGEGATPRYHEIHGDVDRLWRAVGGPPVGLLFDGNHPLAEIEFGNTALDGLVGGATTFAFDADATYWGYVLGFDRPQSDQRAREELRRIAAYSGEFREATAVEVELGPQRRRASVLATVPDDRYAEVFDPPEPPTYPQITWSFDHERRGQRWIVTLAHEAGDEVPTDSLSIGAGGRARAVFDPDADVVGPGDSLTVGVDTTGEPGPYELRLSWRSRNAAMRLGTYEFP